MQSAHLRLYLLLLLAALTWPVLVMSQPATRMINVTRPQDRSSWDDTIYIGVSFEANVSRTVSVSLQHPNGPIQQTLLLSALTQCESGRGNQFPYDPYGTGKYV
jgi:hypothetical protein